MKIDSDVLKSLAQNIIARRDAARIQNINDKKNFILSYADAVEMQLDAVRAVAPAVYELVKAKIRGFDQFFTEGMHHCLGFSNRRKNAIGCCGGGCSGKSLFVDFETGEFIVSGWYDEKGKSTLTANELAENYWNDYNIRDKIKTIANGLTKFAESVATVIASM